MKTLSALILLACLMTSMDSHAKCSVALGVRGKDFNASLIYKFQDAIGTMIKEKNVQNKVYIASSPFMASDSDYYLIVYPVARGFLVSVNDVLVNRTFFDKEYSNSMFASEEQVVNKLISDLTSSALPKMEYCN